MSLLLINVGNVHNEDAIVAMNGSRKTDQLSLTD
jgi:hypothetical protein